MREWLSLEDFKRKVVLDGWMKLYYVDKLQEEGDSPVELGALNATRPSPLPNGVSETDVITTFTFTLLSEDELKGKIKKVLGDVKDLQTAQIAQRCKEQVIESCVRTGILVHKFERESLRGLLEGEIRYAVLVADTSALRRKTLSYLAEMFPRVKFWGVIPTVSLVELQERSEELQSQFRKEFNRRKDTYRKQGESLRIRPLETIAPFEIKYLRENMMIELMEMPLEVVALSQFRAPMAEAGRDRLILECIKNMRRSRGLVKNMYLVTHDKLLARFARIEDIPVIYADLPGFPPQGASSFTFHPHLSRLFVCPVHSFLWDLAQVFSTIIAVKEETKQEIKIDCYDPTKGVEDWFQNRMMVSF